MQQIASGDPEREPGETATLAHARGRSPMRERVAIVFMTLNVMATLALGGAIAYDFAHRGGATTAQPAMAAVAGQAYTAPASSSSTGTPSSGATFGTPTPPSSGAP